MQLSKIGEFGLIRSFRKSCAGIPPEILKGIGDDTAAIRISKNITLITTDMLLEGTHFNLSFATFYQLGYKTLAVNMSDIFAMGGEPRYFLIGLGIPKTYSSQDIDELYSGMTGLARKAGITIVGGDTCASRHGLVLSGTLIGETRKIIARSGAKSGDGIFVTDTLGDSAMGLMLLKKLGKKIPLKSQRAKGKRQIIPPLVKAGWGDFQMNNSQFTVHSVLPLLKRHLMPEPKPLEKTSTITSMIDISDGLLIDLSHICDESNVGARIYTNKIPISKALMKITKKLGMDPLKFALKGGEDYALLFTAPANIKTKAVRIGEIVRKGRFLIDATGRERPFEPEGYEHFK